MYIETSSNNFGLNVYCSFNRTDIQQISKISFYYDRFSAESVLNAMGRFRIHLLLCDNIWKTRYNIAKTDRYGDCSTQWTLVSLYVNIENCGNKMIYDDINCVEAHICFNYIMITHFGYSMDHVNCNKELFESIFAKRKVGLIMFLTKNVVGLVTG